jgi:predicted lysophospholipase L1 biosynthesis ABC-type transport system permease subunit
MGRGSFDGTGLGVGAQVAPGPLAFLDVDEMFTEEGYDEADFRFEDRLYAFLAIDVHGDPAPVARDLEPLAPQYADLKTDLAPTTIRDLDRVRDAPVPLAALLAVVAAAALAHQLASSVRERRHELALLRMLGFSSSQLRRTVASQSALLAGVAVLLGVPLGLALGRIVLRTFATGLHVDPSAPMPWPWVVGAAPAALLLATALALAPAARAARVRAAPSLRDESR